MAPSNGGESIRQSCPMTGYFECPEPECPEFRTVSVLISEPVGLMARTAAPRS